MSVTAADACEEAGLVVPPLPPEIREELRAKVPEVWDWLGNPVDGSIMGGISADFHTGPGQIPRMLTRTPHFDLIVAQVAEEAPLPEEIWTAIVRMQAEEMINLHGEQLKPLVAVVTDGKFGSGQFQDWRWNTLAEQRARLVAAGVPTYSTVAEAARAVRQVIEYWQAKAET